MSSPISRGFRRLRRPSAGEQGRVPPGQYVTQDFPVLSAGPTPHTPLPEWTFSIRQGGDTLKSWTWPEFQALPAQTVTVDIHCVTRWTKLETTWKVVLPAAAPGILTGMILAMARAAGEVAPLMIVGMVKLAPSLPVDGRPPFLHLERKFMHLGFHIYDVGFQSPNVEATKPLVFATALLLIAVITVVNLAAIALRNHLRRKYATSAV